MLELSQETPRASRIPSTLQAVFLASNRGSEVSQPPPQRVAAKMFNPASPMAKKPNVLYPSYRHALVRGGPPVMPLVKPSTKPLVMETKGIPSATVPTPKPVPLKENNELSSDCKETAVLSGQPVAVNIQVASTAPLVESRPRRVVQINVTPTKIDGAVTTQAAAAAATTQGEGDTIAAVKDTKAPQQPSKSPAAPLAVPTAVAATTVKLQSNPKPVMTPHQYLDAMISHRGYSTKTYSTLQTAYYNRPTELQEASYSVKLLDLVRNNDLKNLNQILRVGISPNPCNQFGESLVHLVCRRGTHDCLAVLLANGCSIQVSDDYGRTPLHDACWAPEPSFELVTMLLQQDVRLLHLMDARGATPLTYARQESWGRWIGYLESQKDVFWPVRDVNKLGPQDDPELAKYLPHTRPLRNPRKCLSVELAQMVATGRLSPDEAEYLKLDNEPTTYSTCDEFSVDSSTELDDDDSDCSGSENDSDDEDDDDDDGSACSEQSHDYSDSGSADYSDCDSSFSIDEEEMGELLHRLRPAA